MESIIQIKGNVTYTITLDPTVWIFDDRKQKMEDFFKPDTNVDNSLEAYTKAISEHWDREITEGAIPPEEKKEKKKTIRETLTTESFGIRFDSFLKNSQPKESAESVVVVTANGEYTFPIEQAYRFILQFAEKGKPLTEDGPAYLFFSDSQEDKLTHIKEFLVL